MKKYFTGAVIPDGFQSFLSQPLELTMNRSLTNHRQRQWEKSMVNGYQELTKIWKSKACNLFSGMPMDTKHLEKRTLVRMKLVNAIDGLENRNEEKMAPM